MEIGVKTAIKDIGKSANYSFAEMNELTKLIDKWTEENPSPTFEMLDELKNSVSPQDIKYYTEFKAMEQKYSEVFRLARRFEGIKKTFGSHASGILITPFEISSILPVRVHEGRHITMYTGEQLESLNFIKFDILGLKTLDILQKTINQIDNNMKLTDLYEKVAEHFNDKKMYSLLADKKTDCVFQLESNMFKGLCSEIKISEFGDIVATTAVGRPGPLSAGLNERYAKRKNGKEVSVDPLPNLDDLLSDTYGCIIYQENIMQIAKKVAKVNNNQADSLFRKAIAKKKADLFEICKRVFIYGKKNCEAPAGNDNTSGIYYDPKAKYGDEILGGINNGYEEKELINFMEELKGYSSYLFNKSHAATYSFISLCTLYLKKYYPLEYYASYLSVKSNEIEKMLNLFRKEKIVLLTPDINLSKEDYSVKNKKSKQILMGLCSIKGFGEIPMQTILSRRPFKSLDEVLAIEKGLLNKKAITGLISSGATDELEPNRYKALNMLLDNRKAKDERYNEDSYTKASTRALEKEYLEIALTNPSFWNLVETNKLTNVRLVVLDKTERPDKNNNMMANITVQIDEDIVEGLVFAKCYCQNHDIIIPGKSLYVKAKKDDKDKILINSIIEGAV